ncbi:hypothetical protein [Streptomyces vinaceus]|uniref:hypothetical protein n=1 Tax=Streptomyces vinaceus TaxID=1960 RepID=UPI0037F43026
MTAVPAPRPAREERRDGPAEELRAHSTALLLHARRLRAGAAALDALIHAVPRLTAATVRIDHTPGHEDPHAALAHHRGRAGRPRDRSASAAHMEWVVSRQGGVRDRREGAGDGDSF